MSLFRNERVHLHPNSGVDMSKDAAAQYVPKIPSHIFVNQSFVTTAAGNVAVFTAPTDTVTYGQYKVVQAWVTADASAAAGAVVDVRSVNVATAITGGTSLLNANININTGLTLSTPLLANLTPTILTAGQRLAVVVAGTLTGLVGLNITFTLERV